MGYNNLIDAKLKMAFNAIKDLAKDAVLTKKNAASFNFGTGSTELSGTETISTKIVISQTSKKADNRNMLHAEILLKSSEVGDLNSYSTISFDSQTWTFGQIPKNDGFIVMANIYREA